MPLPRHAHGHSLCRGITEHRLQFGQVGRPEVVIPPIGWRLVDEVPAPVAPLRRRCIDCHFEGSLTLILISGTGQGNCLDQPSLLTWRLTVKLQRISICEVMRIQRGYPPKAEVDELLLTLAHSSH